MPFLVVTYRAEAAMANTSAARITYAPTGVLAGLGFAATGDGLLPPATRCPLGMRLTAFTSRSIGHSPPMLEEAAPLWSALREGVQVPVDDVIADVEPDQSA